MEVDSMTLRIAFGKGRGAASCIRLLEAGGIGVPDDFAAGRLTRYVAPAHDIECYLVRGEDLPGLLASGHVDVAVGSSILFDEHGGADLVRTARLTAGLCRLSLITLVDAEPAGRRLSTRYPQTAARLLANGTGWKVRRMRGCVETTLFLGLADAIVDIVNTGWTVRTLSLHERMILCPVQHEVRLRHDRLDYLDRVRALLPGAACPIGKHSAVP
jgi:ATP phosphoribosyltransferase